MAKMASTLIGIDDGRHQYELCGDIDVVSSANGDISIELQCLILSKREVHRFEPRIIVRYNEYEYRILSSRYVRSEDQGHFMATIEGKTARLHMEPNVEINCKVEGELPVAELKSSLKETQLKIKINGLEKEVERKQEEIKDLMRKLMDSSARYDLLQGRYENLERTHAQTKAKLELAAKDAAQKAGTDASKDRELVVGRHYAIKYKEWGENKFYRGVYLGEHSGSHCVKHYNNGGMFNVKTEDIGVQIRTWKEWLWEMIRGI